MIENVLLLRSNKVFSAFGYKATTTSVAKLANVGKGTIYTFFKNKEELFGEIISNLITEMKQVAESAIRSDVSFLKMYIEHYIASWNLEKNISS